VLRRYLIGLFLVVIYTSCVAWIGFGPVFHLPHATLLAITVGVLELIPVIGPFRLSHDRGPCGRATE